MTILMVTPYAPYRDGIATYAVQEVRRLRADGVDVEVLSPLPSAAHHHLALGGVRGMAALARRARGFDSVVIQFSPEMIFGACRSPVQRVGVWAGLEALARIRPLEIRLHEVEYGPLERNPAERAMAARALRAARQVTVHTAREVDQLRSRLGIDPSNVELADHGASFVPATTVGRSEARAELGLGPEGHVFLAIGFLQAHKGYDLAVEAFARANPGVNASLHVVGSVRVDHPELVAYARRLAGLCRATPGVELHQRYVSDEEFDRWIVAADTVVLPYREIWSSGVMERAKLYGRPVIAADVGGMADQAPEGTLFFDDVEGLVQAMKERVHGTIGPLGDGDGDGDGADPRPGPVPAPGPGRAGEEPWVVDAEHPNRRRIEAQLRQRVRRRGVGEGNREAPAGVAVDGLVALGPVQRPHAVSARRGVTEIKRTLRRLLDWEIEPVVTHVDRLQRATLGAVADLDARLVAIEDRLGDDAVLPVEPAPGNDT
ncbi:MAG: glycosyltransferase family 4 protein [Acidimicrobiales bacterium]